MDYSLAKKLKDAGFPQEGLWGLVDLPEKVSVSNSGKRYVRKAEIRSFPWHRAAGFKKAEYETVLAPTLEELIEVCPTEMDNMVFSLQYFTGRWHAGYEQYESYRPHVQGSTPTEAVALLFLALHAPEVEKEV